MAGGQGTRFWPYSTKEIPKQFLSIVGKDTLIKQTFDRLNSFIPAENIFVVADGAYREQTLEAIPGFVSDNYIAEPCPRNTAPCLMLSNIVLSEKNPEGNVLVVPADHYIPDVDTFGKQMRDALVKASEPVMVTAGVKPAEPHTGYGYINFDGNSEKSSGETGFYDVNCFVEKPDFETAEKYVKEGTYFWNSGMFIYNLKNFRSFLEQYSPYYFECYVELEKSINDKDKFVDTFVNIKPESIDYVLMEKLQEVVMYEAGFEWNDVGAWSSVYELNDKDSEGNAVVADKGVVIDSKNSLLFTTEEKPVAIIGLDNVAVVNTPDGILVADVKELQKVKQVLKELK